MAIFGPDPGFPGRDCGGRGGTSCQVPRVGPSPRCLSPHLLPPPPLSHISLSGGWGVGGGGRGRWGVGGGRWDLGRGPFWAPPGEWAGAGRFWRFAGGLRGTGGAVVEGQWTGFAPRSPPSRGAGWAAGGAAPVPRRPPCGGFGGRESR
jgi:hypothetical protein